MEVEEVDDGSVVKTVQNIAEGAAEDGPVAAGGEELFCDPKLLNEEADDKGEGSS